MNAEETVLIPPTLSLSGFQGLNNEIYIIQNNRYYGTKEIAFRMLKYAGRLHKQARRNDTVRSSYCLCMALSWLLALANRLHINLETEIVERYPNVCPKCASRPCSCGDTTVITRGMDSKNLPPPSTLKQFQLMFMVIYPNNTLRDSAGHLMEEVAEVCEALDHFIGTHELRLFGEVVTEMVDVFAHLCAVANCANIEIHDEMVNIFSNGCPSCFRVPCDCGFVTAQTVVH